MKMILKLFLGPVSNYYTFKKITRNVILFNKKKKIIIIIIICSVDYGHKNEIYII